MDNDENPEHHHRKGVGADLILPVAAALYALYYLYTIRDFPWEAQINGTFISLVLWVLVALFLARLVVRLRRDKVTLRMTDILAPKNKLPTRLGFIGLTALSIFLVDWLGFTLSVFLFLLAAMILLGVRAKRQLVLVPTVSAVAGYVFFIVLLETKLPPGPIELLLKWVF